jgi:hypothetical protein
MTELRETGGSGGNSVITGAEDEPRSDSQSIAFRLTKNETATTAMATRIVLGPTGIGRRIVPPD